MPTHLYFAYFFGGAFFANALPHLIAGVSGLRLPTPFASPPFRGLSSPVVNVAWALFNLAVAYGLLVRIEAIDLQSMPAAGMFFVGFSAMALQCARAMARIRSSMEPQQLPPA